MILIEWINSLLAANNVIDNIGAFLAGALLSALYLSGLWWTVNQLGSSKHVALLFTFSMLLRTTMVVVGFYYILGDNWLRLLAGLLGYSVVRIVVTRRIQQLDISDAQKKEAKYAP